MPRIENVASAARNVQAIRMSDDSGRGTRGLTKEHNGRKSLPIRVYFSRSHFRTLSAEYTLSAKYYVEALLHTPW
jgi:hypothetical protein